MCDQHLDLLQLAEGEKLLCASLKSDFKIWAQYAAFVSVKLETSRAHTLKMTFKSYWRHFEFRS